MTQHAMAILIDDIKEGENLSKVLCSSMFEKILKACLWSSFAIEWSMFKDFKKNFYEILNDKKLKSNKIIEQEIITESKKKTSNTTIENKITNKYK